MAVKGPPPPMPRPVAPRPGAKAPKGSASKGAPASSKGGGKARSSPNVEAEHMGHSPVDPDLDAEERIGFERRRAAELEEEGRKQVSGEGDAEAKREEDLEAEERLRRISWGEERRRRGRRNRRDDDDDTEDAEEAAAAAAEAKAKGLTGADGAGKYFQDMPEDRMGDLELRDPNAMKRVLGPSVRFAQHAMLLAQHELESGTSRASAIAMLADLYAKVGDRGYANKALREFGPATGILDIYPLEVVDHLLEHVPAFFDKLQRGRFLTSSKAEGYRGKVGEALELTYPPELRIRGFAIKGGARPGYLLEPTDPTGTYSLTFLSPGHFEVLISAIQKDGKLFVEELAATIEPGEETTLTALERERAHEAEAGSADKPKKDKKKDDLTFHFPRRI